MITFYSITANIKVKNFLLICSMKIQQIENHDQQEKQQLDTLLLYLELGDIAGKKGDDQSAIDYYIKGLQIARELKNKPRVQQFSNLILTYL